MKNFKRKMLIILMVIASTTMLNAQTKFGIRGGFNASNVSFGSLPDRSERYGFHVGVFVEVPITANFMAIQPELSYSVKGSTFTYGKVLQTLDLNYIDFLLPLVFKINAFDLKVGAYAAYLVSTPDYTFKTANLVMINAFNKVDGGLTAGIDYNFSKLLVGLRYNQGLVDITTDTSRPFMGAGKNAVGQVSLGYKF
jgi:hypothetical protein